jgi:hypothetical protein
MNLGTCLKSALVAASLLAITVANAEEKKIIIKMYDQAFQGQSTLKLKVLAKAQYPGLNLGKFDLERVRLVAKSRRGNGKATLRVGQRMSNTKRIAGTQSDFRGNQGYTYDRLVFTNPKNNSNGNWQMDLGGKIKVKRVVLFLDRKVRRPSRPTRPGGPISKSCTATLETFWGQDLQKITRTASGRNASVAKNRACDQAIAQCRRMLQDTPFLMCSSN